ncbi:HD domain-containing protein [Faecalibaculum rodentium]|uniref:HD domain-containing protein n=1 Tax=Faecalibaculum rodentium TaxID=1702221 RepID=UPI00262ABC55|nr:HD domain-containing protein [Faecalibaculum rodentium]
MFRISEEDQKHIVDVSRHLCRTGELARTRDFIQHGHTTVYTHVHHVARIALWLNRKLNLKADRDRVIRSALLHDYFLYDCMDSTIRKWPWRRRTVTMNCIRGNRMRLSATCFP